MKKRAFLLAMLFLAPWMTLFSTGGKVNFSGTWLFNKEKTTGAENARFIPAKLVVAQSGNELTIERVYKREYEDDFIFTEKLTLDGKECITTVMETPKKSTVNWSADSTTMTIVSKMVFERDGNQMTWNITELWNLSDGGKTLSADLTSSSQQGESKYLLMFDKAPEPK